jgi:hypothetical protein
MSVLSLLAYLREPLLLEVEEEERVLALGAEWSSPF